jgi:hypothetical protein
VKAVLQGWAVAAAALAAAIAGLAPEASRSDPEPPVPLAKGNAGAPEALAQCGDCHMVYSCRMLPARSWTAILARMEDHFGENAAVQEKDLSAIRAYLTSNAADSPNASGRDRHFMSAILPDSTPLRITATPWWGQMHADFHYDGVPRSKVKAADCLGCHGQSDR